MGSATAVNGAAAPRRAESAQERGAAVLDERARQQGAVPRLPRVVDVHELMSMKLQERQMLLAPWLQSQSLAMVYAWRGVGKTFFSLGIAYALASGGEFLGWRAPAPGGVLYLDGEMPGVALKERLANLAIGSATEPEPGFFNVMTPDLQPAGMPDLATEEGQAAVEAVLDDAKVIIVDNISCLVRRGKENEADAWQPVAEWALHMRARGRTVLFVHHAGKTGAQRGTSKREDLLDVVILLKRPANYQAPEGARFEIHFEKARSLFGQEVAPVEAQLCTDAEGQQGWAMKACDDGAEAQMIEMAGLGLSYQEIANELGCNKSTVSRNLVKAENEGRFQRPAKKKVRP